MSKYEKGDFLEKESVTAWESYPRPQLKREQWMCLNGMWEYAITSEQQETVPVMQGTIQVPFCVESEQSGVGHVLLPEEKLWYQRSFQIPNAWGGKRILLHFGAVDWKAVVRVNGKPAVEHTGGYTPFSADITGCLREGDNILTVEVTDPTDAASQPRGKQSLDPKYIFYTSVSGIWQSVWLEPVNALYITGVETKADLSEKSASFLVGVNENRKAPLRLRVIDADGKMAAETEGISGEEVSVCLPDLQLWSPEHPYLYDLEIEIEDESGRRDAVKSYFAMREFGISDGGDGCPRMLLNGEPYFQVGVLDQGYRPEGIYTAPGEAALERELKQVKRLGYRMIRKHVKVEPAIWYALCDRLGLIVWQDMVSGGKALASVDQMMNMSKNLYSDCQTADDTDESYRLVGRKNQEERRNFEVELMEMIEALKCFPCIGVWVLFNESWGQFDSARLTEEIRRMDSTRLVDSDSGWIDQGCGDIHTFHTYEPQLGIPEEVEQERRYLSQEQRENPKELRQKRERAWAISECGGFTYTVPGHEWMKEEFGYTRSGSLKTFRKSYREFMEEQVKKVKKQGCSAIVYTQLTDVEGEMNGLFTYDRSVCKVE